VLGDGKLLEYAKVNSRMSVRKSQEQYCTSLF